MSYADYEAEIHLRAGAALLADKQYPAALAAFCHFLNLPYSQQGSTDEQRDSQIASARKLVAYIESGIAEKVDEQKRQQAEAVRVALALEAEQKEAKRQRRARKLWLREAVQPFIKSRASRAEIQGKLSATRGEVDIAIRWNRRNVPEFHGTGKATAQWGAR
ncbi:hypothetical protein [Citrobacter freundii]|uniref:hypothetical protein n=1 Tax=Citrobacter freundii TaxID=546 RepID=UPI0028E8D0D0|nr:hypothetical protein [Citrobacter freundii]WNT10009.1 hypothetical protein RRL16_26190 [Citrobacter freundii]HCL6023505.1 hypothetical protein [Citrobacter freundii]